MHDGDSAAPPGPTPTYDQTWTRDWGALLRAARQVAGLSLTELGTRTGLSKGYLSKLESGHPTARNPSRSTLAALSRALPSFGPLAHTLDVRAPIAALALDPEDSTQPTDMPLAVGVGDEAGRLRTLPQLGWRELEVVVALLVLRRAAVMQPISALLLGRAVGRPRAEVEPVLAVLRDAGLLTVAPPLRPGAHPTYAVVEDVGSRLGLDRIGDILVLAAALLARGPGGHATRPALVAASDERRTGEG